MTRLDTCIKWIDRMLQLEDLKNDRHDGASKEFPTWREQFKEDLSRASARTSAPRMPKISFNLETASWLVPADYLTIWSRAYPAVNIPHELEVAAAWLVANPQKAPRSNYSRFLNGWMKRTQDKGGTLGYVQSNRVDKAEAWAKQSQ